jgi:hypothetical protein
VIVVGGEGSQQGIEGGGIRNELEARRAAADRLVGAERQQAVRVEEEVGAREGRVGHEPHPQQGPQHQPACIGGRDRQQPGPELGQGQPGLGQAHRPQGRREVGQRVAAIKRQRSRQRCRHGAGGRQGRPRAPADPPSGRGGQQPAEQILPQAAGGDGARALVPHVHGRHPDEHVRKAHALELDDDAALGVADRPDLERLEEGLQHRLADLPAVGQDPDAAHLGGQDQPQGDRRAPAQAGEVQVGVVSARAVPGFRMVGVALEEHRVHAPAGSNRRDVHGVVEGPRDREGQDRAGAAHEQAAGAGHHRGYPGKGGRFIRRRRQQCLAGRVVS